MIGLAECHKYYKELYKGSHKVVDRKTFRGVLGLYMDYIFHKFRKHHVL